MTRPAKTPTPDELRQMATEAFRIGCDCRTLGWNDKANAMFLTSCEMMDLAGVIEAREAG